MGCAFPEGATGCNIARQIALRAGCPSPFRVRPSTASARRACRRSRWPRSASSRARPMLRRRRRRVDLVRAERDRTSTCCAKPGSPSTSPRSTGRCWRPRRTSRERYGISREAQDEYGAQSQQRAAAAQRRGKFDDEIVPMTIDDGRRRQGDRAGSTRRKSRIAADEGIRADTTYEASRRSSRRCRAASIAAGNASQFSDGAAAAWS